jgi:four helix bundle protein
LPSNITEGIGRQHEKEKTHFLHIARDLLFELQTQVYPAPDLIYVSNEKRRELLESIIICKKLINGFIKILNRR